MESIQAAKDQATRLLAQQQIRQTTNQLNMTVAAIVGRQTLSDQDAQAYKEIISRLVEDIQRETQRLTDTYR